MENECSAIPSRLSLVSDTTGSSPLLIMCKSSANRWQAASASSVLWVARPGNGTLRTVVRFTSLLCVVCLNMHLQPGHLGCQLPLPASLRIFSWRLPEPSPDMSALPLLMQSSWNSSCPLFQRVSKESPSKELTSGPIFHQPTIVVTSSSPHADSA